MLLVITIGALALFGIVVALVQEYERKCAEAERTTRLGHQSLDNGRKEL